MSRNSIDDLLTKWSLGTLSESEQHEFEAALRSDPDARRRLRQHAMLDELLRSGAEPSLSSWPTTNEPVERKPSVGWTRFMPSAALAASLLILVGLPATWWQATRVAQQRPPTAEQTVKAGCAQLVQTIDAEWDEPTLALKANSELQSGRYRLKKGMARLEFYSGASLTLEGDAELNIASPWEATMTRGKARVHVPPAAVGFTLNTSQGRVVDLGTEYGLEVAPDNASAEIHVFDGEVELHPAGAKFTSILGGQAVRAEAGTVKKLEAVTPERFPDNDGFEALQHASEARRQKDWWKEIHARQVDPRLIAFYPMQRPKQKWERYIFNSAEPKQSKLNGGIVGANWNTGRWSWKDALEFKRPGDRVRLKIPGRYDQVTLACWARIDSLDRKYNALMLTDGYDHGELHWQVYEDGTLMFSAQSGESVKGKGINEIYFSKPFFDNSRSGQWFHLAVTYDNCSGQVKQYVNGELLGSELRPDHHPAREIVFGACEFGNWGLPTPNHEHPIRNLNGRLDEFAIYKEVLSAEEIGTLYRNGL